MNRFPAPHLLTTENLFELATESLGLLLPFNSGGILAAEVFIAETVSRSAHLSSAPQLSLEVADVPILVSQGSLEDSDLGGLAGNVALELGLQLAALLLETGTVGVDVVGFDASGVVLWGMLVCVFVLGVWVVERGHCQVRLYLVWGCGM